MASVDNEIWNPEVIHVIPVIGPAGSGKSTFARELSRLTDIPIIDKDVAAPLVEGFNISLGLSPNDRSSEKYLKHVRPAEYDFLRKVVVQSVSQYRSIIADAPFGPESKDETWRRNFEQECIAAANGKPVAIRFIQVYVSDQTLRERLTLRNDPRDKEKLETEEKLSEFITTARSHVPVEPYYRVDCSKDGQKETTACALKVIEALHLLPPAFSARPKPQRIWQLSV